MSIVKEFFIGAKEFVEAVVITVLAFVVTIIIMLLTSIEIVKMRNLNGMADVFNKVKLMWRCVRKTWLRQDDSAELEEIRDIIGHD